ncbi:hypothetical protein M5K25_013614 [Dendrobium thyrsiflorum]|uniref:Uncharacterized protein n=1 Tax=Dendrobium thyrsiflorum TaxID=117978 RepID=A0ABD0UUH6_DENTH
MLTVIEELVSTQMVKYDAFLSKQSIVDIEDEATERLEALYPTLKELALAGSPGSHHWLHCRNSEECRFPPAFIVGIPRNTSSHHWPSFPKL